MKRAVLLLALAASPGCGGPPPPEPMGDTFIAFQSSFEGYESWSSRQVDGHVQGVSHLAGPRTVFINKVPDAGVSKFPLGTIIVKQMNDGSQQVFGMVKRGGGYNSTGAVDWEWFELKHVDAELRIVWRGVGPPAGEMYAGDPNGGCNGCHASSQENDFVRSIPLSPDAGR